MIPPDLSKPLEKLRVRIYEELAGLRLDQALARLLSWRTRSSIQRMIREGRVRLERGGKALPSSRASTKVQGEDIVEIRIPQRVLVDRSEGEVPDSLTILHEDPYLVAIDKPPGLAVHPSGRRLSGTLINMLHGMYRNLEDPTRDIIPKLCHRLDRETSGIILVAKDPIAHSEVRKQFEKGKVQKTYLALVEGRLADDEGWIDERIGPAERAKVRLKMAVRRDGQESLTRYKVLARSQSMSLVECRPQTGRQHQIRVHLAHIGHPIVGDKLYGPDEEFFLQAIDGSLDQEAKRRLRLDRHALHNHRLALKHPETGDPLNLECPLPADMRSLFEADRA